VIKQANCQKKYTKYKILRVVIETKQSDAVPSYHERNIFKPFVQLAHAHTAMSCIHLVYVAAVVESGGQCTEYKVYKLHTGSLS